MAKYVEKDEVLEEEDDVEEETDDLEDEEEDVEEDEEEDNDEEVEEEKKKEDKKEPEIDPDDVPRYSTKHLTKLMSAKHNRLKNQFSKKLEEIQQQSLDESDKLNAIVGWLEKNSNMSREQILSKIGYTPSQKKATVDSKLFEEADNGRSQEELDAEVNEIEAHVSKYPGFKDNKKDIVGYAKDTGLSVAKAYWALMGPVNVKKAKEEGAREVIEKRETKRSKVTESMTHMDAKPNFTKDVKIAAKLAGMTPEDYVKYSQIDNYDAFQNSRKKKK
jgi:hypothetical protein